MVKIGQRYSERDEKRPWCCPEPRCTPLTHVANGDITQFESGESWWCWGVMAEPVTFIYDGNQHDNEFNSCFYSALKGVVRSQECEDDWRVLRRCYTWLVDHGLKLAGGIRAERNAAARSVLDTKETQT